MVISSDDVIRFCPCYRVAQSVSKNILSSGPLVHPEYLYTRAPSSQRKCRLFSWLTEIVLFRKRRSLNFNQSLHWIWIYIPLEGYSPDDIWCVLAISAYTAASSRVHFQFWYLILANYNRLFFANIFVNILCKEVSFLRCLNIRKSN